MSTDYDPRNSMVFCKNDDIFVWINGGWYKFSPCFITGEKIYRQNPDMDAQETEICNYVAFREYIESRKSFLDECAEIYSMIPFTWH